MKKYQNPAIEILELSATDVIATSLGATGYGEGGVYEGNVNFDDLF